MNIYKSDIEFSLKVRNLKSFGRIHVSVCVCVPHSSMGLRINQCLKFIKTDLIFMLKRTVIADKSSLSQILTKFRNVELIIHFAILRYLT